MTPSELISTMKCRRISQICAATRDIDRTLRAWCDLMGVGPWLVLTSGPDTIANVIVNNQPQPPGTDFRSYCALTELGNAQLELIQPLYGDEALPAFLDRNGDSWHHFKEHVPGDRVLAAGREYLEKKGLDIVSYGEIDEDRYLNVGTYDAVGANFELGNTGRISFPPEFQRKWPEGDTAALAAGSRRWLVTELTFVTDDLDRALKNWEQLLDVGPWKVATVTERDLSEVVIENRLSAAPFAYRRALTVWGDKYVEVVQPLNGLPVFEEYARRSVKGMHSVVFHVPEAEFDARLAAFAARGVGNRFGARLGSVRFASLDTEKILGVRVVISTGTNPEAK